MGAALRLGTLPNPISRRAFSSRRMLRCALTGAVARAADLAGGRRGSILQPEAFELLAARGAVTVKIPAIDRQHVVDPKPVGAEDQGDIRKIRATIGVFFYEISHDQQFGRFTVDDVQSAGCTPAQQVA